MKNEDFIIKNYNKLGLKKCSEQLSLSKGKVLYIVKKFNLKMDPNVNIKYFNRYFTKHSCYLLGLLWADGYIKENTRTINLECIKSDMFYFEPVFKKTGDWSFYERQRGNYKITTKATTSNTLFNQFLCENDYHLKSIKSPIKILSIIPNNLICYFLLGVIDGDGCFYFNKEQYLRHFSISGSLNQDWSSFEKIFNFLNIKYKINRRPNQKNGSSFIRVTNKSDILKLGSYIYTTINEDKIGLKRKYEKYLEMIK